MTAADGQFVNGYYCGKKDDETVPQYVESLFHADAEGVRPRLWAATFPPLTQLPEPIRAVAWVTPLFHGVELIRGSILDQLDPLTAPIHLAYLLAMFGIGAFLAERNLITRMAS